MYSDQPEKLTENTRNGPYRRNDEDSTLNTAYRGQ